jgi:hypothetical protein
VSNVPQHMLQHLIEAHGLPVAHRHPHWMPCCRLRRSLRCKHELMLAPQPFPV